MSIFDTTNHNHMIKITFSGLHFIIYKRLVNYFDVIAKYFALHISAQNLHVVCLLGFCTTGTFSDDPEVDNVVDDMLEEDVDFPSEKKEPGLMTRKGSWHSHISQRSRHQELSIGGIFVFVLVFFKVTSLFSLAISLSITYKSFRDLL